jgi:hypothetical protein
MHSKARRPSAFRAAIRGLAGVALALGWAGACHTPDTPVTGVVVGVMSDLRIGVDLDELTVERKVGGQALAPLDLVGSALKLPLEIRFDDLTGGETVEAVLHGKSHGVEVIRRDAQTTSVSGKTLLLRAPLSSQCVAPVGPTCPASTTCASGACVAPYVDPSKLPAYSPDWSKATTSDVCKSGSAPVVTVGEGQADYLPLTDMEVVQVEAGPQGGYHVWLAARMKGLRQSGSVITLTGSIPELSYDVAPSSLIFTFDPDEGGYCKIYGLRFRLDDDAHPVASLLGKELDVKIQVSDPDGDAAEGSMRLRLSSDIK